MQGLPSDLAISPDGTFAVLRTVSFDGMSGWTHVVQIHSEQDPPYAVLVGSEAQPGFLRGWLQILAL